MAFKKKLNLDSDYIAESIRLRSHRIDKDTREALGIFKIYKDSNATTAATHQVMKVRLLGPAFDAYFSKAAKAAAKAAGQSIETEAILYRAAKERPELTWSDFDKMDPADPTKLIRGLHGAQDDEDGYSGTIHAVSVIPSPKSVPGRPALPPPEVPVASA